MREVNYEPVERERNYYPVGFFRGDEELVPRLCGERHRRPRAAGCAGRIEAGAAEDLVRDEGIGTFPG